MEELVEKAKNGDELAFTKLILPISPILEGILSKSRIYDKQDREDIMQNTMLNAFKFCYTLENVESFNPWIIRICKNECAQFFRNKQKEHRLREKCIRNLKLEDSFKSDIYFQEMISGLKEKEQQIFKLRFQEKLTTKQISKELQMNENTVKSVLSRGKKKIKDSKKHSTFFIFVLCMLIATTIIAVSIISYIKGLFELRSMGKNNDGVLMAIEHLEWYQELEMDYIDLGNGYQMRAEYLLMDEMNLYIVLDITSQKDVSKFTDIAFPDLKIVDEEGRVICNEAEPFGEQYSKKVSAKLIEGNQYHMRVLVYMYTDSFPKSKALHIYGSKISLTSKAKPREVVETSFQLEIYLSEQFINRSNNVYHSENTKIKKAIITETGFYAIVEYPAKEKLLEANLVDEKGNVYNCYYNTINGTNYTTDMNYIILTNFNDKSNKKLTLRINGIDYPLSSSL